MPGQAHAPERIIGGPREAEGELASGPQPRSVPQAGPRRADLLPVAPGARGPADALAQPRLNQNMSSVTTNRRGGHFKPLKGCWRVGLEAEVYAQQRPFQALFRPDSGPIIPAIVPTFALSPPPPPREPVYTSPRFARVPAPQTRQRRGSPVRSTPPPLFSIPQLGVY
jgi:hypothetical protein